MKEFAIEIVETLSRIEYVEADNEYEALVTVSDMYHNEEIVLDSSNHIDTDFSVYEE